MKVSSSIRLIRSKNAIKQIQREDHQNIINAAEHYAIDKKRCQIPRKGMFPIALSFRSEYSSPSFQFRHKSPSAIKLSSLNISSSSQTGKYDKSTQSRNSTKNRQKNDHLLQRKEAMNDIQSLSIRMHRIMEKRNSPHVLGLTQTSSELAFNKTILHSIDTLFTDLSKALNKGAIQVNHQFNSSVIDLFPSEYSSNIMYPVLIFLHRLCINYTMTYHSHLHFQGFRKQCTCAIWYMCGCSPHVEYTTVKFILLKT